LSPLVLPSAFRTLPPPRSTLFPYTTLFRSGLRFDVQASCVAVAFHAARRVRYAGQSAMRPRCRRDRHQRHVPERTLLRTWGSFRSEEHTSELQSRENLVCRLLLEKKKKMAK